MSQRELVIATMKLARAVTAEPTVILNLSEPIATAVPMITRATPTSARAAAASALRTPPPACTGTSTPAAIAAIR